MILAAFLLLFPAGSLHPVGGADSDEHWGATQGEPTSLKDHMLTESASCPLDVLQQAGSVNR